MIRSCPSTTETNCTQARPNSGPTAPPASSPATRLARGDGSSSSHHSIVLLILDRRLAVSFTHATGCGPRLRGRSPRPRRQSHRPRPRRSSHRRPRFAHGVPHISASHPSTTSSSPRLILQPRQIASGRWTRFAATPPATLAEVLGTALDRSRQAAAYVAVSGRRRPCDCNVLPPDQLRWLEDYARGVNASIAAQQDRTCRSNSVSSATSPRHGCRATLSSSAWQCFRTLPPPFPDKLNREALSARLSPELLPDLYPVGSWRDHPVAQPRVDLTVPHSPRCT